MLFNKKETKMAPMPEAEPAPSEERRNNQYGNQYDDLYRNAGCF